MGQFSVSETGALAWVGRSTRATRVLVWVDRDGREEPIAAPPRVYSQVRISPDGSRAAAYTQDDGTSDVWIWEFDRDTLRRLTLHPGHDFYPIWTPDGLRVAFGSPRGGVADLYWRSADGTGGAERLTESPNAQVPHAVTPDGQQLVFRELSVDTGGDLHVLSLGDGHTVTPLVATEFDERNADLSRDGRWLAYQSDESGQLEVYVRPFPDVDADRWQISTGGGTRPLWAPDGSELFYQTESALMSVSLSQNDDGLSPGPPEVVLEGRYVGFGSGAGPGRAYDVSPDGQKFLMIKDAGATGRSVTSSPINVVLNWAEELTDRVPIP